VSEVVTVRPEPWPQKRVMITSGSFNLRDQRAVDDMIQAFGHILGVPIVQGKDRPR